MSHFSIAGLQLELQRGSNFDAIADEVRSVRRRMPWLNMVVLPELCAFGPSPDFAETLPGWAEDAFAELAKETGLWLVNGSLIEKTNSALFNTTTVFDPSGAVVARHRKLYPFRPYEAGIAAGDTPARFEVPGVGVFGIALCFDIWFPEVARTLAWSGVEVLINPVMTNTIDRDAETAIVRATAAQNQLYVVSINIAGDLGVGQSLVVGPGGEVIHQAGRNREIIVTELDMEYVRRCRERGWHGLGQVLKSFRDGPQQFDVYANGPGQSPTLNGLGPLTMPEGAEPHLNNVAPMQSKRKKGGLS